MSADFPVNNEGHFQQGMAFCYGKSQLRILE